MIYKKEQLALDNPLSFWEHFKKEERILFYNPLGKELIIGAKRITSKSIIESLKGVPYVFSTMTFFDSLKEEKWEGLGDEAIIFGYYLAVKDGIQTLYYFDEFEEIINYQIKHFRHIYQFEKDDYTSWKQLFDEARAEISALKANKIVVSREVKLKCNALINVESIIQNLLDKNRTSFIFAYHKNRKTFLGATPELLVRKQGENIFSYALAGTIPRILRDDEAQKSILLNDSKNCYEHQIVLSQIVNTMKEFADEVEIGKTSIMTLKNLHHIQTPIYARDTKRTLIEWAKKLHPTPAMGGSPTATALRFLREHEKHERGLYAAPFGFSDPVGNGIFVAAIRSALIIGNTVFAYAGCGIIEQSECKAEYMETNNKLQTILESL